MNTIWKFPLEVTDVQKVAMPSNAKLLHVAVQGGRLTLWALVDSTAPICDRVIGVVGTGNPAPDRHDHAEYVGTAFDDPFVWHVFDGGQGWR